MRGARPSAAAAARDGVVVERRGSDGERDSRSPTRRATTRSRSPGSATRNRLRA